MTPAEYIQELKIKMVGNAFRGALCSFFNPNFCREINFTIEDLKELKFMADEMDPKHAYLSMIYNYYIENNKMELTQEQRDTAYAEYKRERSDLNSLRY